MLAGISWHFTGRLGTVGDDLTSSWGRTSSFLQGLNFLLMLPRTLSLFCPSSLLLGLKINTWRGIRASPEVWYFKGQGLRCN